MFCAPEQDRNYGLCYLHAKVWYLICEENGIIANVWFEVYLLCGLLHIHMDIWSLQWRIFPLHDHSLLVIVWTLFHVRSTWDQHGHLLAWWANSMAEMEKKTPVRYNSQSWYFHVAWKKLKWMQELYWLYMLLTLLQSPMRLGWSAAILTARLISASEWDLCNLGLTGDFSCERRV